MVIRCHLSNHVIVEDMIVQCRLVFRNEWTLLTFDEILM